LLELLKGSEQEEGPEPKPLLNRDTRIIGNHDILSARWSAAAWLGIVLVVSSVLALGVALLTT
jgi:hypothetical protein